MTETAAGRDCSTRGHPETPRRGLTPALLAQGYCDNLQCLQGRFAAIATDHDRYMALAYTVRDRLLQRLIRTQEIYRERQSRTVCYLSAEYLPGPHLGNNLLCLGLEEAVREAMAQLGLDLDRLLDQEEEPGLGNGGLGRLAACFLDSLATLEIPAIGYGIRYEFGIFDQEIRDGWQVEVTDKWLRFGNPWEIARPEIVFDIPLGGHTEARTEQGRYRVRWIPERVVRGMAYDTPIPGYRVATANLLRLWKAEAAESFDFRAFNVGDYDRAVEEKVVSENITKVLYPNDDPPQGKRLRLQQQYFLVSCALRDMLRIYAQSGRPIAALHEKYAVQLNDTHPALAVAELMRLLVDEHGLEWDKAWSVTRGMFAYTNHTLLPEALERWSVALFGGVLPRHLEIVYEINRRFLDEVRVRHPGDEGRVARLSLIDESGGRFVRMAHLACVGSHRVNGVARLHSELLGRTVLRDFHAVDPSRFTNVTNGVSPRRFLVLINPGLAALLRRHVGDRWVAHAEELRALEPLAEDPTFRAAWREVKHRNKAALSDLIRARTGVSVDPESMFDVQVKRIHEYKRQHLAVLHAVMLYERLRRNPGLAIPPRTLLFGGKAAPGYGMAKLIIKLIHSVAGVINADPAVEGRLRVVFLPDFNVKNAQPIYPAADLSEQISLAGMEASGTGNMKFAMNGALTIGTADGANLEIREAVGAEHFFLFGLTADEVAARKQGGYRPEDVLRENPEVWEALEGIAAGRFSPGEAGLFRPLVDNLRYRDDFMVLADLPAYMACQERVAVAYGDAASWTRASILNVARIGWFSSDRAIREYCQDIWNVKPEPVDSE
ncbi:MAG TPA: glycogen/starch/alpha-glucan phosphorylase [Verrucomicrobiota bacterium]|nr:glycogen/starch/alpha-glucan phosphorylase [Verrucomicrobiota bacterium]HNU52420.1 glycogen/starch/alpha-glucan phosphorylase [Verrucomicrobiota bacterium]